MRLFKDEKGRQWEASVNYSTIKRIKAALDYDPLELFNGKPEPAQTVLGSAIVRIDTLWRCCEKQAEAKQVSNEDFCDALVGDALDEAWRAFELEIIDFFPPARRKQILAGAAKGKDVAEATLRRIQSEIDSVDPEKRAEEILTAARNGTLPAPR